MVLLQIDLDLVANKISGIWFELQTFGIHLVQIFEHNLVHTVWVGTFESQLNAKIFRLPQINTTFWHNQLPPSIITPNYHLSLSCSPPILTTNTTCTDTPHHLSLTTHHLMYQSRLFHLRSVAHTYLILIIYLYLYMYRKKSELFKFLCDSTYRVCLREYCTLK